MTAATAGIGLGIARRLAREGAKVFICSRCGARGTAAGACVQTRARSAALRTQRTLGWPRLVPVRGCT